MAPVAVVEPETQVEKKKPGKEDSRDNPIKKRGKPRKSWIKNIETTSRRKINECSKMALEREEWRSMVSNLCRETELR